MYVYLLLPPSLTPDFPAKKEHGELPFSVFFFRAKLIFPLFVRGYSATESNNSSQRSGSTLLISAAQVRLVYL